MKHTPVSHRTIVHSDLTYDVYEPTREGDRNGSVVTHVTGCFEEADYNAEYYRSSAEDGQRVIVPHIIAGASKRDIIMSTVRTPEYQDSDSMGRVLMAHSAGNTANLSDDDVLELADTVQTLIMANAPYAKNTSSLQLIWRFALSVLFDIRNKRSISHLPGEIDTILRWCEKGDPIKELQNVAGHRLDALIPVYGREFGSRMKVIVDTKTDVLTPPQPIIEKLNSLDDLPNGKPQVIEANFGHTATKTAHYYMKTLVGALGRLPSKLRELQQKFRDRDRSNPVYS